MSAKETKLQFSVGAGIQSARKEKVKWFPHLKSVKNVIVIFCVYFIFWIYRYITFVYCVSFVCVRGCGIWHLRIVRRILAKMALHKILLHCIKYSLYITNTYSVLNITLQERNIHTLKQRQLQLSL